MRGYQKKQRTSSEVELNMAAMLDMAFQLLAFFILTFKPSPVEAQISLRMPAGSVTVRDNPDDFPDQPAGLQLAVYLHAEPNGDLARIVVGAISVPGTQPQEATIEGFARVLQTALGPDVEGVVLHVERTLSYQRLMQVVEACSRHKDTHGQAITKISFAEMR